MSIDLTLVGTGKIGAPEFVEAVLRQAHKLTATALPELELFQLVDGHRRDTQLTIGTPDTMFVMSWSGRDDAIALVATPEAGEVVRLTFSAGATRSHCEYVLALIAATTMGDLWRTEVLDDNHFWGISDVLSPARVTELFLPACGKEFDDLCKTVVEQRRAGR